ncbi:MAG: LutB/LldF family L-lactate oxidation iron-sulfur protein [Gammaproteobacteria bacterium]
MIPRSPRTFKRASSEALGNVVLRQAMDKAKSGFVDKRAKAVALVPEFERLRDEARDIKNYSLDHLDALLEQYEQSVTHAGGHVHWADSGADLRKIVVDICKQAEARNDPPLVAKGKSMVGEEVDINQALEDAGLEVIETDLGEYIIQLADEPPSHIIAPAVHKTKEQIADLFEQNHPDLNEHLTEIPDLVNEARRVLRQKFLAADIGITGANLLIAESGTSVLVTNEGNGDLSSNLPRVHIVIAGIEKVIPTLDDASTILRVLARSATGQPITSYTSFFTGPKREGDLDGPEEYHVVLVDNGRTGILNSEFREMLRCIRCGACMNHCPVYAAVGGHAYGSVYPGPMGSVLTPFFKGMEDSADLPNACTLNGRCATVCPVRIPLPDLLRKHRNALHRAKLNGATNRLALSAWAWAATHPSIYRFMVNIKSWLLARWGKDEVIHHMPTAKGWTETRDLPKTEGESFFQRYAREKGTGGAN